MNQNFKGKSTAQSKLYVVVRSDLSIPQQAVQSTHAAIEFGVQYASEHASWH